MSRIVNIEQAAMWNGAEGAHWAENHARYDTMAGSVNVPLFEAAGIAEDDHVLDIGCGTGQTSRLAARKAIRGQVLGIDLSHPMLERARRSATEQSLGNVTFEVADAQVHPLPEGRFDVAISRAGVMFFADPVAAFANIGRALKPGGRLVFVCHRSAGGETDAIHSAIADRIILPEPTTAAAGVATFTDPEHIRKVLSAAGFLEVLCIPAEVLSVLGEDPVEAAEFLFAGSLKPFLRDADEASWARARDAVAGVMRRHADGGAVRMPSALWLATAARP